MNIHHAILVLNLIAIATALISMVGYPGHDTMYLIGLITLNLLIASLSIAALKRGQS